MSGSERGALPVQLPGPAMRALVRAVAQMSEADLGRYAGLLRVSQAVVRDGGTVRIGPLYVRLK